jgi:hypothetical protein
VGRPRAEIDLKRLEELAAAGLRPGSAALELGLEAATLYNRLRNDAEARAAWERGVASRKTEKDTVNSDTPRAASTCAAEAGRALVKRDVLAQVRAGNSTRREIKDRTGHGYHEINLALYALEADDRLLFGREDGAGIMHYYPSGGGAEAEEPAQAGAALVDAPGASLPA